MKKLFCIATISLLSTVLHQSYTTAFHVEPILSPITEFLYSYDKGLGILLSTLCDCSEVKSCSCNFQLGSVSVRADVNLKTVVENVTHPTYLLESVVFVGMNKIYEEKQNLNQLEQRCLVFEDKDSYVVNKHYCIKYRTDESNGRTKVGVDLLIKERGRILSDVEILSVQNIM